MIKKTITFRDLDNNEVTRDFYFNISKAELAKLILVKGEGFEEKLRRLAASNDGSQIIPAFEEFLALGYGVRGDDNISFHKSPELFERFKTTDAYSVIFMELVTNATYGAEFIRGMMPADLTAGIPANMVPDDAPRQDLPQASAPAQPDYTTLSQEELIAELKRLNRV